MLAGCSGRTAAGDKADLSAAVVTTKSGAVRGQVDDSSRMFSGIPYAAAPVGERRFREPAPATGWSDVRDATTPGAWCPQIDFPNAGKPQAKSEDCLYLNVTTPRKADGPLPVMVWLHGGAFVNGAGDIYTPRALVSRGIIVVTINYRLGTLGFLADHGLSDSLGNYGLLDQQAALRWVRDNIGAFGGDPGQVTIAGQSAGAMSVCDHLVAPGSKGLFRAAIIQSGPCQAMAPATVAVRDSIEYEAKVGCVNRVSAPQCLRALPVDKLLDTPEFTGVGLAVAPVTGTPDLPMVPMDAFTSGSAEKVPVMIGTDLNESTWFQAEQYSGKPLPDATEYRKLLGDKYGGRAEAIAGAYPVAKYNGNVLAALAAVDTDATFACPTETMTRALAASGPVFAYEFADPDAPEEQSGQWTPPLKLGATHGSELGYLFDYSLAFNPQQKKLSDQMIGYWAQFVKTGSPNGVEGQPHWPTLSTTGQRLTLAPPGPKVSGTYAADHQCALWRA